MFVTVMLKSPPKAIAGLRRGLVFARKNRRQVRVQRILVDLGLCPGAEG